MKLSQSRFFICMCSYITIVTDSDVFNSYYLFGISISGHVQLKKQLFSQFSVLAFLRCG